MTLTLKFFMELLQSWSPTNVSGDAYIISIAPFFISSSVSNDDPEKIFSYLLRVYAKVSTYCTCMAAIGYCYTHTHTQYTECLNAQGLGASEKKKKKKILYNTTRGRTRLLPFF